MAKRTILRKSEKTEKEKVEFRTRPKLTRSEDRCVRMEERDAARTDDVAVEALVAGPETKPSPRRGGTTIGRLISDNIFSALSNKNALLRAGIDAFTSLSFVITFASAEYIFGSTIATNSSAFLVVKLLMFASFAIAARSTMMLALAVDTLFFGGMDGLLLYVFRSNFQPDASIIALDVSLQVALLIGIIICMLIMKHLKRSWFT